MNLLQNIITARDPGETLGEDHFTARVGRDNLWNILIENSRICEHDLKWR